MRSPWRRVLPGAPASDTYQLIPIRGSRQRALLSRPDCRLVAPEVIMLATNMLRRMLVSSAIAGGLLMATGAMAPVLADHDYSHECSERLERARTKLDADIAHHGERSRQADHDRAKLEDARNWCRGHHADYDHDRFDNDNGRRDDDHRDNDRH